MEMESGFEEKTVSVEVLGRKAEIAVNSETVFVCEDIKSKARSLLKELKSTDEDAKECPDVATFLKESIERLGGEELISADYVPEGDAISELSVVLCSILSQLRETLVEEMDE